MGDKYRGSNDVNENDTGLVLHEIGVGTFAAIERRLPGWRLTRHFRFREFWCKDGTRPERGTKKTYRYLCRVYLEPMRRKFGACSVHSGYRTPSWNQHVGGENGSFHVNDWHDDDDVAGDVSFARGTPDQWAKEASRIREHERNGRGGIGVYPNKGFIHIDTRDYPADWRG